MPNQLVRAAGEGIPVAGGLIQKLDAATNATLAPYVDRFLPSSWEKLPEANWSERYAHALAAQRGQSRQFEEEHPIASTAAGLAGGVGATLPLAATAGGARLLGMVEGGLGRQMGYGALSGAGIGAADALTRGGDMGTGAGIGGVAGAAGPVAGRMLGAAWQTGSRLWRGGTPPSTPQNIYQVGGVRVPLSSGQVTGDVATQMFEQGALRNAQGQAPQRVAEQFFRGLQDPAVEQARGNIGQSFSPTGQAVVDNPQAAGEIVGERVRAAAAQSRQGYQGLYRTALELPGEIHASAFDNIGERIKGTLSNRQQPIVVDDVTTPVASRAIQDIDRNISQLRIQNRAAPGGPRDPDSIVGINLQGVDQTRKRLTAMASATERGTADHRAMGQVIHEFDNHVEDAIANGLFTGDDRALDALRAARTAYSEHRRLFTSQGAGDDVGRAMERIVGRNGGDGATPTEVANWLYGSAKVGGTGLSVRMTQHLRDVLGETTPEWAAVRQRLWSRLTATPEGVTDFGHRRMASRIGEFLTGSGAPLAQTMFSPAERRQMQNFMNLQMQLEPRPGTVNYSNTAPVLRQLTLGAFRNIMLLIGDAAAGPAGALAGWSARSVADRLAERSAAGRVARSLYQTPARRQADTRFLRQMGRWGGYLSRLTPTSGQPSDTGFHPASIGAQQAPDGNHYLPDPTRPGKYVRVDWH
jgi:hypothetical protein